MDFIRLLLALGILVCISLFIHTNLVNLKQGSGYMLLVVSLLLFFSLVAISRDLLNLLFLKRSAIFLLFFIFYFTIKWYFDSYDLEDTQQATIGTTGGLVFSLILGIITAYALKTIYELRKAHAASGAILIACFLYILFVIGLSVLGFKEHFDNVRGDVFLIEDGGNFYQRAGDLISIQFITIVSLATVVLITATRIRIIRSIPILLCVLVLSVIFAATAQIIGSNSGLATSLGLSLVFFVSFFATRMKHGTSSRVGFANMLLGQLGVKLVFAVLISLSLVTAFVVFVVSTFNFDISTLRFTGFGSGELSSLEARNDMLRENFMLQFSYNPIFGHTKVEELTTGEGTYIHSLLSIATHLGLVGATIFVGLIVSIYFEITHSIHSRVDSIYTNAQYGLFRLATLLAVIAMALVTAFFVWMPLWFAIGLFGNWFQQKSHLVNDESIPVRRRRRRRARL